jgi:hypothetical protein
VLGILSSSNPKAYPALLLREQLNLASCIDVILSFVVFSSFCPFADDWTVRSAKRHGQHVQRRSSDYRCAVTNANEARHDNNVNRQQQTSTTRPRTTTTDDDNAGRPRTTSTVHGGQRRTTTTDGRRPHRPTTLAGRACEWEKNSLVVLRPRGGCSLLLSSCADHRQHQQDITTLADKGSLDSLDAYARWLTTLAHRACGVGMAGWVVLPPPSLQVRTLLLPSSRADFRQRQTQRPTCEDGVLDSAEIDAGHAGAGPMATPFRGRRQ